ncbi:MAG: trypsin-like peptidase domain-containing protein [Phycisphaerales bacterium]|nr:MAG: trypsin-like peptidase domain-containing protein [Phycisphaerales bacterium]
MRKATVMVFTRASERSRGDTILGSGSGFFINGTGLVITNNHVVDPTHLQSPAQKQEFHYNTGKLNWTIITDSGTEGEERSWDAEVLYQNEAADQALLQVYTKDGKKLRPDHFLRLLPESRLKKRLKVWALGFPGGDGQRPTGSEGHAPVSENEGHVLAFPRTPGGRIRMIYTDVVARPGNSGGPVVDQDGFLVGTVTLMQPPEGREDTGGAKYSSLVPAKLTGQMVRNAFDLGKITEGTDLTPFMDVLTKEDGRIVVPEFKRFFDRDVLFYDNGDRIYGTVATDTVTWDSAIGAIEVPTSAIAYIMMNSDGAHLFLEGGNHIQAPKVDGGFQFKPQGGSINKQAFSDVSVVSFRQSGRTLEPVAGEVITVDTDVCHLVLADIRGKLAVKSRAGTIETALDEIERIETGPGEMKVILFTDGRRLTGKLEKSQVSAAIATTNTAITLDLGKTDYVTLNTAPASGGRTGGLGLMDVLASADSELKRIAKGLLSDDPGAVRTDLDNWLMPAEYKSLRADEKEQVTLLKAVSHLREGAYSDASRAFRKSARSKDENLAVFARAHADVLKRLENYRYDGKPLSDPAVFAEAGSALADESIREARDFLRAARRLEGNTRGEFAKGISRVRRLETAMLSAAIFAGPEADDELIRVWKFATHTCENEIRRIGSVLGNADGRSGGSSSGRSRGRRTLSGDRDRRDLEEKRDEALDTAREYLIKMFDYGFRIEDPDIQESKDKEGEFDRPER